MAETMLGRKVVRMSGARLVQASPQPKREEVMGGETFLGRPVIRRSGAVVGRTKEGRPIIQNPDGSVSSERSITIEVESGFMNIPSMFGGKQVSPEEAIRRIREAGGKDPETGRVLPVFPDRPSALGAAKKRSQSLGRHLRGR